MIVTLQMDAGTSDLVEPISGDLEYQSSPSNNQMLVRLLLLPGSLCDVEQAGEGSPPVASGLRRSPADT